MKPRKIKNVKVANRALMSSERSTRRKSLSPRNIEDTMNTTGEESLQEVVRQKTKQRNSV